MRPNVAILTVVLTSIVTGTLALGAVSQQGVPAFPIVYGGKVSIQGAAAPDGLSLVACVAGCDAGWESKAAKTLEGRYVALKVEAPESLVKEETTFWLVNEFGRIKAKQTANYEPSLEVSRTLDLEFDEPMPTPPPPTPTPTPTVTPTPLPTPGLPIPGDPSAPRLANGAIIAGIAALLVGGAVLLLARRRREF